MELISVDCPNCGATLPPQEPGGHYRCTYCGGEFRIDQAKKAQTQAGVAIDPHALAEAIIAAQRKAAEQAKPQAHPQQTWIDPVPVHQRPPQPTAKGSGCRPIVLIGVLAAAGAGVAGFLVLRGKGVFENVLWDNVAGPPQVVQVNGESAVVGRTRAVGSTDHLYCGVYDPDGDKIWRTESLGTYSAGYQSTFCGAIGDAMIVTTQTAQVHIHDLTSGDLRKTIELSDAVDYLCVPQDPKQATQAWIKQIDEREHLLDIATGQLTPSPQPDWCFESRHEAEERLQGGGSWADAHAEGAPEVPGVKVEFVFVRDGHGVALGHTEPGTKVPTAVAFDPATKQIAWQQAIPSVAKATLRDTDKYGAIAGDKFIATYGAGQDDWYITALDLATGKRVWETKLRPIFAVDSLNGLVASSTHAYLVRTSSLEIFDVETGKLTGTIGKETYD